jgi:hypothetical protein
MHEVWAYFIGTVVGSTIGVVLGFSFLDIMENRAKNNDRDDRRR